MSGAASGTLSRSLPCVFTTPINFVAWRRPSHDLRHIFATGRHLAIAGIFDDLVTAKETLEYHAAGRMVVLDVDPERLMVRAQMELAARSEMLLHRLRRTSETFRDN